MTGEDDVALVAAEMHQAAVSAAQQAARETTGQPLDGELASAVAVAVLRVICLRVADAAEAAPDRRVARQ